MPIFMDFPSGGSGGGFAADWDGLAFNMVGNPGQFSGLLTFTLLSDGTWTCPVPHVIGTESGNWFTPTTADVGEDYEARFTPTGFAGLDSGTSNGASTWTALSFALAFGFELSGDYITDNGTVLVEIRDATSLAVVASGTFSMSITLT